MQKFTPSQKAVVAALFGHSNMGQRLPSADTLRNLFHSSFPVNLSSAVVAVSGDLMESDEHQQWFEDEAKSWMKDPKLDSLDSIRKTWPHMAALIEEASQNV